MFCFAKKRIYLDHASGTPCSKKVIHAMNPYFTDIAFNPGGMYKESVIIKKALSAARNTIADILKAQSKEIYFVDGATEANNIAIVGTIDVWKKNNPNKKPHMITTVIEHAAVLETARHLDQEDVLITYLDVDSCGNISLKQLKESLTPNTVIVSIGYVNGEIGTIQDIRSIMKTVRHYRKNKKQEKIANEISDSYPYVHTDAVQAVNYVETLGVPQLGVDLMTINGSKIYGPKKIAALYVKNSVKINSLIHGGNQENGLRSGTENVPYIIGFAQALFETRDRYTLEVSRLTLLQEFLHHEIINYDNKIIINSSAENKIPNIVNISVPDISHEEIVIRLDAAGFMCSVKSACKIGEDGDSHVITSLRDNITGSLRISLGRETCKKDLKRFMKSFIKIIDNMKDVHKKYYQ
jgi:cysteine desulfurase